MEISVRVKFKNITVGAETSGLATPVESFTLNGFVYKIDTNGTIYPDSTTTGGSTHKYLVFDGVKFSYTNDINGQLFAESSASDTGYDSFWMMIDADNVIWFVGATSNGSLDPKYIS